MEIIPRVSIKPGYLAIWNELVGYTRSQRFIDNQLNLLTTDTKGLISDKARKRIQNAIDWFLCLANDKRVYSEKHGRWFNFKINFVTLTLASKQEHPDKEIKKKLLHQFLIEARRRWDVKKYIWRAEAQKNGNIHFHIVTDKWIHYRQLRYVWNRIQNKLGYVDRFEEKQGHDDPNSTDIHSIKKIKNISAYLSKYCTKNDDKNRKVEGKLWGLSFNLSRIKSAVAHVSERVEWELNKIEKFFANRVFQSDYFTIIRVKIEEWRKLELTAITDTFFEYLWNIKKWINQPQTVLSFEYAENPYIVPQRIKKLIKNPQMLLDFRK